MRNSGAAIHRHLCLHRTPYVCIISQAIPSVPLRQETTGMRPVPLKPQHQLHLLPPSFLLRTRYTPLKHNNQPNTPIPPLTPTTIKHRLPKHLEPASTTQNQHQTAPLQPNLHFTIPLNLPSTSPTTLPSQVTSNTISPSN
jgi:hypothetical protein